MQLDRGDGDNPSTKPGDLNVLMTLSGSLTRPTLTQSYAWTKGAQRAGVYQLAHILRPVMGLCIDLGSLEKKQIRPPHNEHKPSLLSGSSGSIKSAYPHTGSRECQENGMRPPISLQSLQHRWIVGTSWNEMKRTIKRQWSRQMITEKFSVSRKTVHK